MEFSLILIEWGEKFEYDKETTRLKKPQGKKMQPTKPQDDSKINRKFAFFLLGGYVLFVALVMACNLGLYFEDKAKEAKGFKPDGLALGMAMMIEFIVLPLLLGVVLILIQAFYNAETK